MNIAIFAIHDGLRYCSVIYLAICTGFEPVIFRVTGERLNQPDSQTKMVPKTRFELVTY